jgi:hypothetical protein
MQAAAFNLARADECSGKGGRERNAQSTVADGVSGDLALPILKRPAFAESGFEGAWALNEKLIAFGYTEALIWQNKR